jgi:hypothetical protein
MNLQDDAFGFSNLQIKDHFSGEEQKVTAHYEERIMPNYMMGGDDN